MNQAMTATIMMIGTSTIAREIQVTVPSSQRSCLMRKKTKIRKENFKMKAVLARKMRIFKRMTMMTYSLAMKMPKRAKLRLTTSNSQLLNNRLSRGLDLAVETNLNSNNTCSRLLKETRKPSSCSQRAKRKKKGL